MNVRVYHTVVLTLPCGMLSCYREFNANYDYVAEFIGNEATPGSWDQVQSSEVYEGALHLPIEMNFLVDYNP